MREKERKGWEKYRDELIGWIAKLAPRIEAARKEKDDRTLRNLLKWREGYVEDLEDVLRILHPVTT